MFDDYFKSRSRLTRGFSSDDILSALGLQRTPTTFDAAGSTAIAFIAGAAAGAGIALLLAPKSGREVRQDITNRATELTQRLQQTANELTSKLQSTASELTSEVRNALPIGENSRNAESATRSLSATGSNRTS